MTEESGVRRPRTTIIVSPQLVSLISQRGETKKLFRLSFLLANSLTSSFVRHWLTGGIAKYIFSPVSRGKRTAFDICPLSTVWYLPGICCTALLSSWNASKAGESLQILAEDTVNSMNKTSTSVYPINRYTTAFVLYTTYPLYSKPRGRRRKTSPPALHHLDYYCLRCSSLKILSSRERFVVRTAYSGIPAGLPGNALIYRVINETCTPETTFKCKIVWYKSCTTKVVRNVSSKI